MRKVFKERKYIEWKRAFAMKTLRAKYKRAHRGILFKKSVSLNLRWKNYEPIPAPEDFRLIENTEACMDFFNKIRNKSNHYYNDGNYFVALDLKNVKLIDYCSVSVLNALLNDFKTQRIYVQGNSPENQDCFNFLKVSGFYDGLRNLNNKFIHEKGNSDRVAFTKGAGELSDHEDYEVIKILKKVRRHLTGDNGHCPQLRTIILEICGNSIEHSESLNKQWVLGVKYEQGKVIITLIDTGKGILKTLYRRMGRKFTDFIAKTDSQILEGAFDKKYGSKTLEGNRNKGLPVIKLRYKEGFIKNLIILTNNVFLNFNDGSKSISFPQSKGFKGTIFKIELDKTCFKGK